MSIKVYLYRHKEDTWTSRSNTLGEKPQRNTCPSIPCRSLLLGVCLSFLVVNQKRESKELHCLLCSLLYVSALPHGGKAFVSI